LRGAFGPFRRYVRESERAAHEPRVSKALKLAHSLGVSIDELTDRIYWNPGEMARRPNDRRPRSERLSGFLLVLPVNVPVFDSPLQHDPVEGRLEAAEMFGQNVRAARERRHLTQTTLARASGLSKAGLSLIERGIPRDDHRDLAGSGARIGSHARVLARRHRLDSPPAALCGYCS
jgi:transcriptional regulator with XRE-family HTH domain